MITASDSLRSLVLGIDFSTSFLCPSLLVKQDVDDGCLLVIGFICLLRCHGLPLLGLFISLSSSGSQFDLVALHFEEVGAGLLQEYSVDVYFEASSVYLVTGASQVLFGYLSRAIFSYRSWSGDAYWVFAARPKIKLRPSRARHAMALGGLNSAIYNII